MTKYDEFCRQLMLGRWSAGNGKWRWLAYHWRYRTIHIEAQGVKESASAAEQAAEHYAKRAAFTFKWGQAGIAQYLYQRECNYHRKAQAVRENKGGGAQVHEFVWVSTYDAHRYEKKMVAKKTAKRVFIYLDPLDDADRLKCYYDFRTFAIDRRQFEQTGEVWHRGRRCYVYREEPQSESREHAGQRNRSTWREFFDLDASATIDDVKHAYCNRAAKAHPDHGGSTDDFKRVREFYEMARREFETEVV